MLMWVRWLTVDDHRPASIETPVVDASVLRCGSFYGWDQAMRLQGELSLRTPIRPVSPLSRLLTGTPKHCGNLESPFLKATSVRCRNWIARTKRVSLPTLHVGRGDLLPGVQRRHCHDRGPVGVPYSRARPLPMTRLRERVRSRQARGTMRDQPRPESLLRNRGLNVDLTNLRNASVQRLGSTSHRV